MKTTDLVGLGIIAVGGYFLLRGANNLFTADSGNVLARQTEHTERVLARQEGRNERLDETLGFLKGLGDRNINVTSDLFGTYGGSPDKSPYKDKSLKKTEVDIVSTSGGGLVGIKRTPEGTVTIGTPTVGVMPSITNFKNTGSLISPLVLDVQADTNASSGTTTTSSPSKLKKAVSNYVDTKPLLSTAKKLFKNLKNKKLKS